MTFGAIRNEVAVGIGFERAAAAVAGSEFRGIVGANVALERNAACRSHAAAHAAPFRAVVEVSRYAAPDARVRLRRPA